MVQFTSVMLSTTGPNKASNPLESVPAKLSKLSRAVVNTVGLVVPGVTRTKVVASLLAESAS
jgi:hypothetical protein